MQELIGDHFGVDVRRNGAHFGVRNISGAVQFPLNLVKLSFSYKSYFGVLAIGKMIGVRSVFGNTGEHIENVGPIP